MGRKPSRTNEPLTFDQYDRACAEQSTYPEANTRSPGELLYAVLALAGEAGELANELKKAIARDKFGKLALTPSRLEALREELGDVLWYASRVAYALGVTTEQAARKNTAKIDSRYRLAAAAGDPDAIKVCDLRYRPKK